MLARRAAERGGALLNAARARRYFFPNMYNLRRREGGNPRKSSNVGSYSRTQRVECEVCVGVGWRCVSALRRGTTDLPRASRRLAQTRNSC